MLLGEAIEAYRSQVGSGKGDTRRIQYLNLRAFRARLSTSAVSFCCFLPPTNIDVEIADHTINVSQTREMQPSRVLQSHCPVLEVGSVGRRQGQGL